MLLGFPEEAHSQSVLTERNVKRISLQNFIVVLMVHVDIFCDSEIREPWKITLDSRSFIETVSDYYECLEEFVVAESDVDGRPVSAADDVASDDLEPVHLWPNDDHFYKNLYDAAK